MAAPDLSPTLSTRRLLQREDDLVQLDDDLAPARGILLGCALGAVIWFVIFWALQ